MRQVEESPFKNREDITLLVRNFNFPMPNSLQTQRNRNNVRDSSFNYIIIKISDTFSCMLMAYNCVCKI